MSGICGICEPGRALGSGSLGPMLASLALPDESGNESIGRDSVAMAVARRWDCQQIAVLPGICIAVDADILNRKEIENELSDSGFDTAKTSVAELIARLYLNRGLEFLSALDGPFSLALWDEKSRRLVLAVDRLGVHALYWSKQDARVRFASRVGAIRAIVGDSAQINRVALMQFLLFSG